MSLRDFTERCAEVYTASVQSTFTFMPSAYLGGKHQASKAINLYYIVRRADAVKSHETGPRVRPIVLQVPSGVRALKRPSGPCK